MNALGQRIGFLGLVVFLASGCAATGMVEVPTPKPFVSAATTSSASTVRKIPDLSSTAVLDSLDGKLRNFRSKSPQARAIASRALILVRALRARDRESLKLAEQSLHAAARDAKQSTRGTELRQWETENLAKDYLQFGTEQRSSLSNRLSTDDTSAYLSSMMPASWVVDATEPECTYVDDEDVTWTGECATEQEIADAEALVAAAQDDSASLHASVVSDSASYCADFDNWNDPLCVATDNLAGVDPEYRLGGPNVSGYVFHLGGDLTACQLMTQGCLSDWGTFTAAMSNVGYRIFRLHRAASKMFMTPKVLLAIEAASWQVVGGAALAAIAALAIYECMET